MKDNTKEINKATNLGSLEPLRQYKLPLSILPVHSPTFLSYHGTGVPVPDPAYSYWGIKKVLQFDITAGFSQMMPIHHPRKKFTVGDYMPSEKALGKCAVAATMSVSGVITC
jgi:hypothetical protein